MSIISLESFLTHANGRARARLFTADDYSRYTRAFRAAQKAASAGQPYYQSDDAGDVANGYGSLTTTARWGVWTSNAGTVIQRVDRPGISGRSVPRVYPGGERSYDKAYREGHVEAESSTPS